MYFLNIGDIPASITSSLPEGHMFQMGWFNHQLGPLVSKKGLPNRTFLTFKSGCGRWCFRIRQRCHLSIHQRERSRASLGSQRPFGFSHDELNITKSYQIQGKIPSCGGNFSPFSGGGCFVISMITTWKNLGYFEVFRNPATTHQLRLGSVSPHYLQGWKYINPRWLGMGFLNHQQLDKITHGWIDFIWGNTECMLPTPACSLHNSAVYAVSAASRLPALKLN